MGLGKIGKALGTVAFGPVGMSLIKKGGLPGLLYDAAKDKKKPKPSTPMDEGEDTSGTTMKRGGKVKKMARGGPVKARGDGIAKKGLTRGRVV